MSDRLDIAFIEALGEDALRLLALRLQPYSGDASLPAGASNGSLLSVADAVAITRLSDKTIRRAIDRGDLVARKVCGRLRVARNDLDAWIDAPAARDVPRQKQ